MKINEYVYTELCYFYDQVLAINRVIQANHSEVCAPVNLYITLVWLFVNLVNLNITQISINNALLAYLFIIYLFSMMVMVTHTAVSRKVVLQKGKSLRDNVESYYG